MSDTEEPKIIVDEDWKSQVEQEREQLRKAEQDRPEGADDIPVPPATFQVLLAMLGTQAMSLMGLMPGPDGKIDPAQVNLPIAKHMVDLIGMLEEKTNGNLEQDEAAMLAENLHQLRMAYVASSQNVASAADKMANDAKSTSDGPSIELP